MFWIFVASCLLTFSAARVTDVKKEFPAWPNVYSTTILFTDPYDSFGVPEGVNSKQLVGNIWYDGEAGKVKSEFAGKTHYALKDGNGGAAIEVESNGECEVNYESHEVEYGLRNPLPSFADKAEFISEYDVEGEKVEQWKVEESKISPDKPTVILYIKKQDGLAIPVRVELFPDIPPVGSDMILPVVAEFVEFSTAKPDASVFEIDAGKCKNVTKIPFIMRFF